MFANSEVTPDALPSAERVEWQPLHPRFVRRLQATVLLRVIVFAAIGVGAQTMTPIGNAALSAGAGPSLPVAAWSVFAALSLYALAWPAIAVRYRGYAVRDRDILYRSGVLWRSVRAVPFNRVQHTKTDSTPMDRRFGLANLSVFPAGGGTHKIRGLGGETAERLRAYISARIEAETAEEAETTEEADSGADEQT